MPPLRHARANAPDSGSPLTTIVGGVMDALKPKRKRSWGGYERLRNEEGDPDPVMLQHTRYRHDPDGDLDDTRDGLPDPVPRTTTTRRRCSRVRPICSPANRSSLCTAAVIILAGLTLWQTLRLLKWLRTPVPSIPEGAPLFGTSLGCSSAPHVATSTYTLPITDAHADHILHPRGGARGTIFITRGPANATRVEYEVTTRTNHAPLLDHVSVPALPDTDARQRSRLLFTTPYFADTDADSGEPRCMRYDMQVYLPPNLKKLYVAAHTLAHVRFDPAVEIVLDELAVTLFTSDADNLILASTTVVAGTMALEAYGGWLVGDVALGEQTRLLTQRGDAIMHVKVHPRTLAILRKVDLQTVTGTGRSTLYYIDDRASWHRPIFSTHMSSGNGDLHLTYTHAGYNGYVDLVAKSYSVSGLRGTVLQAGESGENPWAGDKNGPDEMKIRSPRGRVELRI